MYVCMYVCVYVCVCVCVRFYKKNCLDNNSAENLLHSPPTTFPSLSTFSQVVDPAGVLAWEKALGQNMKAWVVFGLDVR